MGWIPVWVWICIYIYTCLNIGSCNLNQFITFSARGNLYMVYVIKRDCLILFEGLHTIAVRYVHKGVCMRLHAHSDLMPYGTNVIRMHITHQVHVEFNVTPDPWEHVRECHV
jgi:hypothetical protein